MKFSQEKIVRIKDIDVNYKIAGAGQQIFILHGWGSSSDSWIKVQEMLAEKEYQIIVPDLPGFGKTPAPSPKASATRGALNEVWGVQEYAEFVSEFTDLLTFKVNKSQKVILAGHSFGGQIAIQYALTYPQKVDKLILIAAAGIRHKPGLKVKVFAFVARFMPKFLKNIIGRRSDYGRSQGIMKDIMKKVIRQDLTSSLSKITVPTLIIWGDKDKETPVQDAYTMHTLIPNSQLEVLPGIGHRVRSEAPEKLVELIDTCL